MLNGDGPESIRSDPGHDRHDKHRCRSITVVVVLNKIFFLEPAVRERTQNPRRLESGRRIKVVAARMGRACVDRLRARGVDSGRPGWRATHPDACTEPVVRRESAVCAGLSLIIVGVI